MLFEAVIKMLLFLCLLNVLQAHLEGFEPVGGGVSICNKHF